MDAQLHECTKAIKLYTLSWHIVWYIFISIKLLKSKYSNNNSGDMIVMFSGLLSLYCSFWTCSL